MQALSRKTVTDASDEAQVTRAQKDQDDRDRDLESILKTERGRRFLYDLIFDVCHVEQMSHVVKDDYGRDTAFNEGGRAVGSVLLERIRSQNFSAYLQMLAENHGDE